jgi:hypothetical protein
VASAPQANASTVLSGVGDATTTLAGAAFPVATTAAKATGKTARSDAAKKVLLRSRRAHSASRAYDPLL